MIKLVRLAAIATALCGAALLNTADVNAAEGATLGNSARVSNLKSLRIPDEYINSSEIDEIYTLMLESIPDNILSIPPNLHQGGCKTSPQSADNGPGGVCYWPLSSCNREESNLYNKDYFKCTDKGVWSLTFDDGPNVDTSINKMNSTLYILSKLKALNYKATFFLIGSNVAKDEDGSIVSDIIKAGHAVGSHSWSHIPLTTLSNKEILAELLYTEAVIYNASGKKFVPKLWRPPCGDVDDRVRAIAKFLGYTNVMWTSDPDRDSGDSHFGHGVDPVEGSQKVMKKIKSWFDNGHNLGFISLNHDVSNLTSEAARTFFDYVESSPPNAPVRAMVPLDQCDASIPISGQDGGRELLTTAHLPLSDEEVESAPEGDSESDDGSEDYYTEDSDYSHPDPPIFSFDDVGFYSSKEVSTAAPDNYTALNF